MESEISSVIRRVVTLLFFSLNLLIFCLGEDQETAIKNFRDYDIKGLKGKVKTLTETFYEGWDSSGIIQKRDMFLRTFNSFDKYGNSIDFKECDNNGVELSQLIKKCDNKGNVIGEIEIDKGSFTSNTRIKNNHKGYPIEALTFSFRTRLQTKDIYIYDEKGKDIIEQRGYEQDGSLLYRCFTRINKEGYIEEKDLYNSNDSLNLKITFKYDDKGNLIERYYFDKDFEEEKESYKYEKFDKSGNWIIKLEDSKYWENDSHRYSIIERVIEYY